MGMPAVVASVPVGAPQLFRPGPIAYCVEAIPAATGTVLIEKSEDNGTTFQAVALGAVATVNSVSGLGSQATIVKVSAFTAAGQAVLMALSAPNTVGQPEFLWNGVPYTVQATLTTELPLFSCRFPAGLLKPNFRMEVDLSISCSNNANVKTIRAYFGNAVNSALEGGTIFATQILTSLAGGLFRLAIAGRNDGTSVSGNNIGSAGGWGSSTTASAVISSSAVYSGAAAVEQALVVSYQKATAADVLSLDSAVGRIYQ